MNLKKLVLVGILSSSILGSSVALADEANREGNIPSKDTSELTEKEAAKAKSEGEIRFKLEDTDPDNPNNSGPLSINRISHIVLTSARRAFSITHYYRIHIHLY